MITIKDSIEIMKGYFDNYYSNNGTILPIDCTISYDKATQSEQYNYCIAKNNVFGNETNILIAIHKALIDVALQTTPLSLIRLNSSVDTKLRELDSTRFVATPIYPSIDGTLDIDDGLSYAVIGFAYNYLAKDFDGAKHFAYASNVIKMYELAYKNNITSNLGQPVTTPTPIELYFRFSADGSTWHETWTTTDKFMSVKNIELGTWSDPMPVIGEKGDKGDKGDTGASSFIGLSDVPTTFAGNANKILSVSATEDKLEFIAPPSGGATPLTGQAKFGDYAELFEGVSGNVELNTQDYNSFKVLAVDNTTLSFKTFNSVNGYDGTKYTVLINPLGYTVNFDTTNVNIYGDVTIPTDSGTLFTFLYDGSSFIVVDKVNIPNY